MHIQIPAILLSTLIYAFWLTFSRISNPTIWPVVWLAFALATMLNPLPVFFKSSRWWLLKNIGDLLISGSRPVEVSLNFAFRVISRLIEGVVCLVCKLLDGVCIHRGVTF